MWGSRSRKTGLRMSLSCPIVRSPLSLVRAAKSAGPRNAMCSGMLSSYGFRRAAEVDVRRFGADWTS